MGSVIGLQGGEVLSYEVLRGTPVYEIRAYEHHPVIQADWQNDSRSTFFTLAGYIGAFEEPQNKKLQKIAMTAPVECLADTENFSNMRFFPPKEIETVDSLPEPLSSSVSTQDLPKRLVAAHRFSGSIDLNQPKSDPTLRLHLSRLVRALVDDGLVTAEGPCDTDEAVWQQLHARCLKDAATGEPIRWSLAAYNPPYCLPFLRRNEIWIALSAKTVQQDG